MRSYQQAGNALEGLHKCIAPHWRVARGVGGVGRLSPSISRQGRAAQLRLALLRGMSTPATERELHALAADSGLSLSPQLLGVVLELLRLDVTPQALLMMLRRVMVRSVELQRAPQ